MAITRDIIVKAGIDNNATATEINNMLGKYGFNKDYNPVTEVENYKQLGKKLSNNAVAMARDLRSLGGYISQPLVDVNKAVHEAPFGSKMDSAKKAFMKAIEDDKYRKTIKGMMYGGALGSTIPKVGPVGGAMLGAGAGLTGSPKGVVNAVLSTYNTDLDTLVKGKTDWIDVVQGVFNNPLYAGFDTAPLTLRGASKVAKNIPKSYPYAVRQLLPDEKTRQFNRQISNMLVNTKTKSSKNYEGYLNLESMPLANREEILKNIIINEGNLTSQEKLLADTIKTNLRDVENEFIRRGYGDKDLFRTNAQAQYVMYKLPSTSQLVHDDIVNIIKGLPLRTGNKVSDNMVAKIKSLAEKGGELYDNKQISFFTQQLAPMRDPFGNVIAKEFVDSTGGYFDTNRIIGRQDIGTLSNVFDRSIKHQLDQFNRYMEVEDTISDLLKNYNDNKLTKDFKGILPKNKVAFSNEAFKNYIKENFNKGNAVEIDKALAMSQIPEEGAYLIDKLYLDMIKKAFKKPAQTPTRALLNSFKKAVLANPHWIALNRIGNLTNNFMNGVTLKDYSDFVKLSKKGYIPEQLRQQTSFNSYINTLDSGENISSLSNIGKSMYQPWSKFRSELGTFKNSDKSLGDYGKLAGTFVSSLSDTTANPFYKTEAVLEYMDRSANIIRQAKRLAEKTGKDYKKILKQAGTDEKLFNQLNTEVNKSLGDYIGRNYALPSGLYNFLSEAVPFYRFLTQTGRTTVNQLKHNPIGFMSNVTIPARLGNPISNWVLNNFDINPEEYKGGVPYDKEDNNIRTIGFEPLPIATVLEDFGKISKGRDLTSLLSPYWSTFPDVLSFRKFGRTATTPRLTEMKANNRYTEAKNFKPTLGETLAYGLNTWLNTTFHPYRMATSYGPEALLSLVDLFGTNKGRQSLYDTNSTREVPTSYKKTLPIELSGKWLGFQTSSNYPKKERTDRTKYYDKAVGKKIRKQIKRNKEKK